jgi:hypothetical protein
MDEGSATVAKDALHNYKLDGENKIKVRHFAGKSNITDMSLQSDHVRKEVNLAMDGTVVPTFEATTVLCISPCLLEWWFHLHHHSLRLKVSRVHDEAWESTELLIAQAWILLRRVRHI